MIIINHLKEQKIIIFETTNTKTLQDLKNKEEYIQRFIIKIF